MAKFKPSDHFMQISRRQRQADGSYKVVSNDYLEVKWRVVWFRDDNPSGQIVTELLSEPGVEPAVVRATVSFTHENGEQSIGVGMGQADAKKWGDYLEKAETRAVGRALAMLGYGTQFAPEFDEEDMVADAPVERPTRGQGATAEPQGQKKSNGDPQFATGYQEYQKTEDMEADIAALTTRIKSAKSLPGIASVHRNATSIGVSGGKEYKSALMTRIEEFINAAEAPDILKQLGGYTEFLGLKGEKYLTEIYTAKMESLRQG